MKKLFILLIALVATVSSFSQTLAAPTVTGSTTICSYTSTTLRASGVAGAIFAWYNAPSGGTLLAFTATYNTPILSASRHFYVQQMVGFSRSARTDVYVTVNPLPAVNAGADVTVPEGTSVTLRASGANSYSWSPFPSSDITLTFRPAVTTVCTVVGTNATTGCRSSDQVTVTVTALPAVTGVTTICKGSTTRLTATGTQPFKWYSSAAGATPLFTGATYTTTVLTANTTYWVSGNGSARTPVNIMVIDPQPPTAITATPTAVCLSNNTSLLRATSTAGLIKWYTAPTGGTLLGTSNSDAGFAVNPTVTTTYYAESATKVMTNVYSYTGAVQTFEVPEGVTSINIDAYGGRGGNAVEDTSIWPLRGGYGGRVTATMSVIPGHVLSLFVGGKGYGPRNNPCITGGGWNGGGTMGSCRYAAGSGGGATDIRASGGQALTDRVLVAGGGGGTVFSEYNTSLIGGAGGGLTGGDGQTVYQNTNGFGGTKIAGGAAGCVSYDGCAGAGSFGIGGNSGSGSGNYGGAGGGGWYGGGGGTLGGCGGGGSSYTNPLYFQNVVHTQGANNDDGKLIISYNASCSNASRIPVTVAVTSVLTTTFRYASSPYCINATNPLPTYSGGANAGIFSATPTGLNFVSTSTGEVNLATSTPGTYSVTNFISTTAGCSSAPTSSTITINATPVVSISTSTPALCIGSSAALTASGALTYSWLVPQGSTGASVTVSPTSDTTYFVRGTNAAGCSSTAAQLITSRAIPNAPPISANGPTTFCDGASVGFIASPTPATDLSFTSVANGGPYGSIQWQSFVPTLTGTLNAITVLTNGCPSNVSTTMRIYTGTGTTGTLLYTTVASVNGCNIQFPFNVTGLTLTAGNTYTFQLQSNTNLFLRGNNSSYGSYFSDVLGLNSGWRLNFITNMTPASMGPVQWYNSGTAIPGAIGATYSAAVSGNYTCKSNNVGCYSPVSNSIAVTVTPAIIPSISVTATATRICNGTSVTFTATHTNGGSTPIYQWKKNNLNVGVNAPNYVTSTLANGDVITCVLTSNATPCLSTPTANSNNIILSVDPVISPVFTQINPVCSGATLGLLPTTSTNGILGTWSPSINNLATTTYTFTPTSGQCASPATMTITVIPRTTTGSITTSICAGQSYTWPANGRTYTTPQSGITIVSGCNTATLNLSITPSTVPTFAPINPICSGATLDPLPTISNNGIFGTWSPSINNLATTTYTFTPTAGQCAAAVTMTITVNPLTTIGSITTAICAGQSYTWPANGETYTTAQSGITYIAGCNIATLNLTINSVIPTFSEIAPICFGGTFTLPTTSNEGIIGSWSPAFNNQETTTYTFVPTTDQCAATVTLTVTVTPNTTAETLFIDACNSYTWPENDTTYTTSGTYSVVKACQTKTIVLTIHDAPTVPFEFAASYSACNGDQIPNQPLTSLTTIDVTFDITGGASIGLGDIIDGTEIPTFMATTGTATITITPKTSGCVGNPVTFTVTISPATITSSTIVTCDTYTWPEDGQTYTSSGVYNHKVGCNTATLHLTINNSNTYYYDDTDNDGFGDPEIWQISCEQPFGYLTNNTDCNPADGNRWQFATFYIDADGDGWDGGTASVCSGIGVPNRYATSSLGADCNDDDFNPTNLCVPLVSVKNNQNPVANFDTIASTNLRTTDIGTPTSFNVTAQPNPFDNNFMLNLQTLSQSNVNLKVYDMVGRLIEQLEVDASTINATALGFQYPSGVYNIIVKQGENMKTLRVIKR